MAPASAALVVFEEHLRQIEVGFEFLSVASSVKRSVPDAIDWTNGAAYALEQVRALLNVEAFPLQPYVNAAYLSSVAAFEEYVRQVVVAAIEFRAAGVASFGELPVSAQNAHMEATGRLLTRRNNPPQQLRSVDFFELCRRLGTCVPGTTDFELNPEALSLQPDLIELEGLLVMLQKFGFDITWDTLGTDAELQAILGTSGPRQTGSELQQYLLMTAQQRNRLAHTGTSSSDITLAELQDHCRLLRVVARAVASSV